MTKLDDIRAMRQALGKSQSEFADLLGISIRAVQSYEQGWRPTPPTVMKLAGLLLMLQRRKDSGRGKPCWRVNDCSREARAECPAYEFRAGDVCWLVSGQHCKSGECGSWEQKMRHCNRCPVMTQSLDN